MAPYAKIEFADGQVYSPRYDDIYYNREDGPAESCYVFLEGNKLPSRWQEKSSYCIAETGFGTGLNFLTTLKSWLDDPGRCQRLDYFAIEAYPLQREQLQRIHDYWPQYAEISKVMVGQYPELDRGCHTLSFAGGRVQLHLVFDTLEQALSLYHFRANSWYLDGFAPARNPSMWQPEALKSIAEQSLAGASLATFTAASSVRRGLEEAGFKVRKRKGFGRKREMIQATLAEVLEKPQLLKDFPWFAPPSADVTPERVAVVGAGIAGAQLAWHLAQRGVDVTVFEAKTEFARGASGNTAGILAPKISSAPSMGESFYIDAFFYQLRQLNLLEKQGLNIDFSQQGLIQLAHSDATEKRFAKLAKRKDLPDTLLSTESISQLGKTLGALPGQPGPFLAQAVSISPRSLCKALLVHPRIELQCSTAVNRINPGEKGAWLELSNGDIFIADAAIIANGHEVDKLLPGFQITPVRGQTSCALLNNPAEAFPALDHDAYLLQNPADKQQIVFGATYQRGDCDASLRDEDTRDNLQRLENFLPNIHQRLNSIRSSHAGVRATTYDRWPLLGPVPDLATYRREYADIGMGKQYKSYARAHYQERIYLLTGLGSRGLCSAGFCANLLAHMVLDLPPPASRSVLHAMHPARFLIRDLKKNRLCAD